MIEMGASIRDMDAKGYTPLHYAVWKCKPPEHPSRNPHNVTDEDYECERVEGLHILDILLKALENNPDPESLLRAIYFDAENDKTKASAGISPFLLACGINSDSVLERFISVLEHSPDHKSLPIEIFLANHDINAFHYLIISSVMFHSTPRRAGTIQKMIDILPHSQTLLRKPNKPFYFFPGVMSPLQIALSEAMRSSHAIIGVIKVVLNHATIEDLEQNKRAIRAQINHVRPKVVEVLLRAGLPMTDDNLEDAAAFARRKEPIRIIELLLAFGYPLHKELGLYSEDELPIEVTSTHEFADKKAQYARYVPAEVTEALNSVRRSNVLLSLQRQCRTKIRYHLRPGADEAIKELPLPEGVKRFLLVENEPPLLGILE